MAMAAKLLTISQGTIAHGLAVQVSLTIYVHSPTIIEDLPSGLIW